MRRLASVIAILLLAASAPAHSLGPGGSAVQWRGPSVNCAAGATMPTCVQAPGGLLDWLWPAAPAADAVRPQPLSSGAGPDIEPTIWLNKSPTLDPTRLPLGNHRMVTDAPKKGSVFACDPMMYSMRTIIGATRTGPWIDETALTYDVTQKVFDRGRVEWPGRLSVALEGDRRVIISNGLPLPGVPTGTFPVPSADPAYQFDRNPMSILEQNIKLSLPGAPSFGQQPRCVYKEVGITLDGVPLHTGLDSSGRDENAYELNDTCSGKPQPGGGYHRHTLSECTPRIREPRAVVGYALDGFAITGPYDADGSELTTDRLDECHGTTSTILWEGRPVEMYHYVFTRDFPYSISCFRGTPAREAFPKLPGAPPQLRRAGCSGVR